MNWLILAPHTPDDIAGWAWLPSGDDVSTMVQQGTLTELAAACRHEKPQAITLLLPAASMLIAPVHVPIRQQRQLQQALPFLLEDSLASDIENLHIVAGARIDKNKLQVAAINKTLLDTLIATLAKEGLNPATISCDALWLPTPNHGAVILIDGANSLVASADGYVFPFDQDDTALIADHLHTSIQTVRVLIGEQGSSSAARSLESALLISHEHTHQLAIEIIEAPRHRLMLIKEALMNQAIIRPPVNLRQGVFALSGSTTFSPSFEWRPLAWLAAGCAALMLVFQIAIGVSYMRAAEHTHEAQATLYRQTFPEAKKVDFPRAQMEGKLRASKGGTDTFVSLMGKTAEVIMALEESGHRYNSKSLAWDANKHQLRIDIVAANLEDIEQLRQTLQKKNMVVDIGSGISQDGGYKARLSIGGRS